MVEIRSTSSIHSTATGKNHMPRQAAHRDVFCGWASSTGEVIFGSVTVICYHFRSDPKSPNTS